MTQVTECEVNNCKNGLNTKVNSKKLSNKDLVAKFRDLLSGREDCWGKVEGECVRENLGDSHYEKHLQGEKSLGIYPISDDGTCNLAVVDFDFKHDDESENKARACSEEFIKKLKEVGIEKAWIEISKSNLRHVWIFFEEHVLAKDVRNLLMHILKEMELVIKNGEVEIFPKQDSLEPGMVGNYINLPYYGALEGSPDTRIMIDSFTGEIISLEKFVEQASINRVSSESFENALEGLPDSIDELSPDSIQTPMTGLIESQRNLIIDKIQPYWRRGTRQELAMCLSGYLAKQDISLKDTLEIIEQLSRISSDDETKQRLASVNSTYKRYSNGKLIAGYSGLKKILNINDLDALSNIFETAKCNEAWVSPMTQDAFYGIAGEIIRTIEPHSEADSAALLINFLVGFGNLLGSKVYYEVEGHRHPTKIFAVLVGKTAKARKGTSWGYVKKILTNVDKNFKRRIQTGLSTGEGLIYAVSSFEGEHNNDKRLLVVEEEFSSIFRKGGREGNTLTQIIRNAWDTDELHVLTRTSPLHVDGAHISILGHITIEELKQHITSTEIHNGFGNRFLWICVARSKELPFGGNLNEDALSPYIIKLKEVVLYAQQEIKIKWAEETKPLWEKAYSQLAQHDSGVVDALTARAEPYVIRIASIYAVLDKTNEIRPEHLRAALAVWRYSEDSVKFIFGTQSGNPLEQKILSFVKSNPQGVSRTDISDNLNRKVDTTLIKNALDNLESKGLITFVEEKTSGRPREIIKPT